MLRAVIANLLNLGVFMHLTFGCGAHACCAAESSHPAPACCPCSHEHHAEFTHHGSADGEHLQLAASEPSNVPLGQHECEHESCRAVLAARSHTAGALARGVAESATILGGSLVQPAASLVRAGAVPEERAPWAGGGFLLRPRLLN